jgi:RNA polymerase sigma-70 factor (ECF subfamily)
MTLGRRKRGAPAKPDASSGHILCAVTRSRPTTGAGAAARQERFRAAYQAYFAAILGYAMRRTTSPEDAADIVAETFLVAWRRSDDLPKGGEQRLWLYGVARRVLANQRRGERRRLALGELLARDLQGVHEDPLPCDREPVRCAWAALREADREILSLAAWEGLGTRELAAVLDCSRTAAKLRLHRARRRFAGELERAGSEWKPLAALGHVPGGRAAACPGTKET